MQRLPGKGSKAAQAGYTACTHRALHLIRLFKRGEGAGFQEAERETVIRYTSKVQTRVQGKKMSQYLCFSNLFSGISISCGL